MAMEFGWWMRDAEAQKWEIKVIIHGGTIQWRRKGGHHQPWQDMGPPTGDDWEKLLAEAGKRVPRRLISPKQFDEIKRLRDAD